MTELQLRELTPEEGAALYGGDDEDHSWLYYVAYGIGWLHCQLQVPSTAYADAKVGYH